MTRLGWSPEVFWAATPSDLRIAFEALMGPPGSGTPMNRQELDRLRSRFPDNGVDDPRG